MSTFDIFTKLPLFKEIEKDALFSLIPKISLDFEHAGEQETLFDEETPVQGLVFLLQGQVLLKEATAEIVLQGPVLLSWTGVFGQHRTHSAMARTLTACSILNIDRKSLIYLIRTEPAFLEAYLDLLSDTLNSIQTNH